MSVRGRSEEDLVTLSRHVCDLEMWCCRGGDPSELQNWKAIEGRLWWKVLGESGITKCVVACGYAMEMCVPVRPFHVPGWLHSSGSRQSSVLQLSRISTCQSSYFLIVLQWTIRGRPISFESELESQIPSLSHLFPFKLERPSHCLFLNVCLSLKYGFVKLSFTWCWSSIFVDGFQIYDRNSTFWCRLRLWYWAPNIIANVSHIRFCPPCGLLMVLISFSKKRELPIIPICGSLNLVWLQSIALNVANGCSGIPDQF